MSCGGSSLDTFQFKAAAKTLKIRGAVTFFFVRQTDINPLILSAGVNTLAVAKRHLSQPKIK